MQTFLRITLLGVFAAAGIAVAIAVATHVELSNSPDEGTANSISPSSKKSFDKVASDQNNLGGSDVNLPILQQGPIVQSYEPPVARKIERLEQKLELMTEATKRDQLARLEERLAKISEESRERQRQIEAAEEKQNRQIEDAARRNEALIMKLAQAVTTQPAPAVRAQAVDETQESPEEIETPEKANINSHSGEGDGMLSLQLDNDPLRDVLEFLSAEGKLNILAMPSVEGNVTASLANVDVETALDAILRSTGFAKRKEGNFVYVGTPAELEKMDLRDAAINTRVYQTNYVTAQEVQKLITRMLTPNTGYVTISSAAEVGVPADDSAAGGDAFAGNEVIVVRDYEKVLLDVDTLVKHVDRRPRQVSIEAMILSVALDDSHKFGINWEFLKNSAKVRVVGNSPLVDLTSINVSEGGLNIGFLDSDVAGFVSALDTVGDTDVIAAPHLMCLNKQRAEILIGDQKGYLSTTQTETATTQTVEFLDLGTQLRVRPFISADGMIRLEVHPELSTGDVKLLGSFALPEKSTTQVTTNVMCRDGCTIVIGGLIREDLTESITQIPLLGNIPVLGAAFRSKTQTVKRDEIIVLLTPRIVEDPSYCELGNECFQDLTRRQATIHASKMTSIGKHHYSNRYYRLANAAWRAGNIDVAVEYLELALHFNSKNKDAMKLQSMIMSGPAPVEFIGNPELEEVEEVEEAPLENEVLFDEYSNNSNRAASIQGRPKPISPVQLTSGDSPAEQEAPAVEKIRVDVDRPADASKSTPVKHASHPAPRPVGERRQTPRSADDLDDPPEPAPLSFLKVNQFSP